MEYISLNNGVKMPILGYGVYQVTKEECERCVLDALKVGYRAIDTAQSYFNEEEVGNAIQKSGIPREEIFLTTKVWVEHYGYEEAKKSVLESMKKLKTDYLDLVLLHQPFSDAYGAYNGFDEEARRNIQNFVQQQAEQAQEQKKQQEMQVQSQNGQSQSGETQKKKPELANWQKVMDNGEYLRSAEMAEEANYNMIDGLMNNTPKKKDKNAPRRSVLKRLRNHQKKIASQGKGQPQQQKAVEEEIERKKK